MGERRHLMGVDMLVTHVDKKRDGFTLRCEHGQTQHRYATTTAEEALAAHVAAFRGHRASTGCACDVVTHTDHWVHASDGIDTFSLDLLAPDIYPELKAIHAHMTQMMVNARCQSCDGGLVLSVRKGHTDVRPLHAVECPSKRMN
jgi:hypothetical protein